MNRFPSVSELPPGRSGIAKFQTTEEICDDLVAANISLMEADEWNRAVARNTPELTALPDSINSTEYLEIKGQEINGSCFAAGLVGVAERQHFQATGQVKRFAIWPCYMLAQMQTGRQLYGRDQGCVPSHGIKVASELGFMPEDTARKYLPAELIRKWGGDVYPRNYWTGRGNFDQAAHQAYIDACRAYEPILKLDEVREEMHLYRMATIILNKTTDQVVESERAQSATTIECHIWGSSMDSDPMYLRQFPGPAPQRGAQHGHHATYIYGISAKGELLKANSWRPWKAIVEARKQGKIELEVQEWGDDGGKIWDMRAHNAMMRHEATSSFACSNMVIGSSKSRKTKFDGKTVA